MAETYRQLAHKLRIQRGPGRPDLVSKRPRNKRTKRYLDDGKTFITFDEHCQADVAKLLRIGAIERLPEPEPAQAMEGGDGGEDTGE